MIEVTRTLGEAIKIAEDVEVVVLDVRNDRVKFGITAPIDVQVRRKETVSELERPETGPARRSL